MATDDPIILPSVVHAAQDGVPYPDLPVTEVVHPQRLQRPTVSPTESVQPRDGGNARYTTIERIEVYQGLPMGPVGPTGPAGDPGADGGSWIFGTGDPNLSGVRPDSPNDIYADSNTGMVWYWNDASGLWVRSNLTIAGPTGPAGPQGPVGIPGPVGPTGPMGGGVVVIGTFDNNDPICDTEPTFSGSAIGDGLIDSCGNLWGWITIAGDDQWYNFGPHVGPEGPEGPGAEFEERQFAFVDIVGTPWARMTINHTFASKYPSVDVLIDYRGDGNFVSNNEVETVYVSPTRITLTAEMSIIPFNGERGKVTLT